MIAFVDEAPTVEPHHGSLLVKAVSGGEPIQLLLSRHAAGLLSHRLSAGVLVLFDAERAKEPIPFPSSAKPRRGKRAR